MADRVGLKAWRERRKRQLSPRQQPPPCLVHVIQRWERSSTHESDLAPLRTSLHNKYVSSLRSSPFSGSDDVGASGEANVLVVHSPKSGVNFFNLGDFEKDMARAARRAKPQV